VSGITIQSRSHLTGATTQRRYFEVNLVFWDGRVGVGLANFNATPDWNVRDNGGGVDIDIAEEIALVRSYGATHGVLPVGPSSGGSNIFSFVVRPTDGGVWVAQFGEWIEVDPTEEPLFFLGEFGPGAPWCVSFSADYDFGSNTEIRLCTYEDQFQYPIPAGCIPWGDGDGLNPEP